MFVLRAAVGNKSGDDDMELLQEIVSENVGIVSMLSKLGVSRF